MATAPAHDLEKCNASVPVAELDRLAGATPLLAVDGLHAGYGRMHVLRDVSLRVARGRSLCLVGPNGAGKSTVLNAIYGFARIFSGAVTHSGSDIGKLPQARSLKPRGSLTCCRRSPSSPT
jgi:branched-chain amino acid transport system ATP-binding protein